MASPPVWFQQHGGDSVYSKSLNGKVKDPKELYGFTFHACGVGD